MKNQIQRLFLPATIFSIILSGSCIAEEPEFFSSGKGKNAIKIGLGNYNLDGDTITGYFSFFSQNPNGTVTETRGIPVVIEKSTCKNGHGPLITKKSFASEESTFQWNAKKKQNGSGFMGRKLCELFKKENQD